MFDFKKTLKIIPFSVLCVFVCACKFGVGLGSAVDVEPPKVSITYPPASAVVRDSFILAGTCSDDQGVSSISLTIKESEKNLPVDCVFEKPEISPLLDSNGNPTGVYSWKVSLNVKKDGVWPLLDGKYTFDVYATDSSGRTSGTSSRTIEIDNTPPVFIISKPGVTKMENATTFGTSFVVSGMMAEDHDVSKMRLDFYDGDKKRLSFNGSEVSFEETNVSIAGGTSVSFAVFDENSSDNNYAKLYQDSLLEDGVGSYYFTLTLEDSARLYQSPSYSESSSEGETSGNMTHSVYLYDSVYESLMGKKSGFQFTVAEIKQILNGTYAKSLSGTQKEEIDLALSKSTDTKSQYLAFKLNRNANPSYSLSCSYAPGNSSTEESIQSNFASGSVTFSASSGLDGTNFSPASLVVYMFGPYTQEEAKAALSLVYGDTGKFYKNNEGSAQILFNGVNDSTEGSGTSFVKTFTLPDFIESDGYYIIAASGSDMDGNVFENRGYYAFKGVATGEVPVLTFDSLKTNKILSDYDVSKIFRDGSDYRLYGKMQCQSPTEKCVSVKYTVSWKTDGADAEGKTVVGEAVFYSVQEDAHGNTLKVVKTSGFTQNESWYIDLASPSFSDLKTILSSSTESLRSLYVEVQGSNSNSQSGKSSCTVYIDRTAPDMKYIAESDEFTALRPEWLRNESRRLTVRVGDRGREGLVYSSEVSSVEYSIEDSEGVNMALGKACYENGDRNTPDDANIETSRNYTLYTANTEFKNSAGTVLEGQSSVKFTAEDGVENESVVLKNFYIDTLPPLLSADRTGLENSADSRRNGSDTGSVPVKFGAKENMPHLLLGAGSGYTNEDPEKAALGLGFVSGIRKVYVVKAVGENGRDVQYTVSSISYTGENSSDASRPNWGLLERSGTSSGGGALNIPLKFNGSSEDLDTFSEGTNTFTVYAEDFAGNVSSGVTFTVDADFTLPSAEITYPRAENAYDLNKVEVFKGTAYDRNGISSVKLEIYNRASGKYVLVSDSISVNESTNEWTCSVDTSLYSSDYDSDPSKNGIQGKFRLSVKDTYGNTAEKTVTAKIDQNADRPVIKLGNIDVENSILKSTKVAYGTVSDDDGSVSLFWIKNSGPRPSVFPSSSNANGWTKITVTSGSWEIDCGSEGDFSYYLYAIDSAGGKFCSVSENPLERMYIYNASDTALEHRLDENRGISFKSDLNPPELSVQVCYGAPSASGIVPSGAWKDSYIFGGDENHRYMFIRASVKEKIGMPSVNPVAMSAKDAQVQNELDVQAVSFNASSESVPGYDCVYTSTKIDLGNVPSGKAVFTLVATDSSGQTGPVNLSVSVDNEPPTVQIISPGMGIKDAVTGAVTVKGLLSDNEAGLGRSLYWTIPKQEVAYGGAGTLPGADGQAEDGRVEWNEISAASSWSIVFDSASSEDTDSILYYTSPENRGSYKIAGAGADDLYMVPFYFYVSDALGNAGLVTSYTSTETGETDDLFVVVDSEGGKPKAWITSPEDGSTTSGSVTVYGGASDDVGVDHVNLKYSIDGGAYKGPFRVTGTNNWKYTIDGTELENVSQLMIQVCAYDSADENPALTRGWTEAVTIMIDPDSPVIKNLRLVQYGAGLSSGTPVSEREYVSGMYLSHVKVPENGVWYLEADVSDNEELARIEFLNLSATGSSVNMIPLGQTDMSLSGREYRMKIPLSTEKTGMIYARIRVYDGNSSYTVQEININIDSTAPSLYTREGRQTKDAGENLRLVSSKKHISESDGGGATRVQNSNRYFTFGDVVNENGSGLSCVAFHFERNGSMKRIINPVTGTRVNVGYNIQENTESPSTPNSADNRGDGDVYVNSDGIPVIYISGAARNTDSSIVSAKLKNLSSVRVGSLLKIGGCYSLITAYDGSAGKVEFYPTVSKEIVDAEVGLVQVVDHAVTEDADDMDGTDDGDGMVESLGFAGSKYTWSASIDSTNIPDGPVDIVVVAMDKAGNIATGRVRTFVSNNRPRLTKVMLATDLDGSGRYDLDAAAAPVVSANVYERTADGKSYGEFNYYSAYDTNTAMGKSEVTLNSASFKVVNGLCIVPEFTGGNGGLKYTLKATDSNEVENPVDAGGSFALTSLDSLAGRINATGLGMFGSDGTGVVDNTYDFGGIELESSHDAISGDGAKWLNFTFFDQTEETLQGSSSSKNQWALVRIPVNVKTGDATPPVSEITPFYWKGASENSVYFEDPLSSSEKKIQGHIELEGDLGGTALGVLYGTLNPKVSGRIMVEGTVTDEVMVKFLDMKVFGTTFGTTASSASESDHLAFYSNGTWTTNPGFVGSGKLVEKFVVENISPISQDGHSVKFTAYINTENYASVVGRNLTVEAYAHDWKKNVSVLGAAQTSSDEKTNLYIMDAVPYVTDVKTKLSAFSSSNPSVYSRTAGGNYVVREGESVQFVGYNIGTNIASVKIEGMATATLSAGTVNGSSANNTISLVESSSGVAGAKSGSVSLSVNGISAMNNINSNDAKGVFIGTDQTYKNFYNRRPNGVNNNILSDDIAFDVWQFKEVAKPQSGSAERVTMKINPSNGTPGFSYANSVLYFNMPGYSSDNNNSSPWGADNTSMNGTYTSQIPFGMNYGGFSHNSFTFDVNGNSYGAAMCTDTQNANASAFLQFFSRETPMRYNIYDQNMNYANSANASRLDSSTMDVSGNGSNWQCNIHRIQSISMVASNSNGTSPATNDNPVYVFMAYYDAIVKQVRFRWGTVGAASDSIDGKHNSTNGDNQFTRPSNAYGLDDIVDSRYTGFAQAGKNNGVCRPSNVEDSFVRFSGSKNSGVPVQVVAGSGLSYAGTHASIYSAKPHAAGEYVALGILNKDSANPKACVFWYDGSSLKMAYNESPTSSTNWTYRTIDGDGGLNVKVAVDGDNGIHLAYYTTNGGNLKYAYIPGLAAEAQIVTVDSHGAVGTKCTIDVAKDSSGNQVPYISYQLIGGIKTYNAKLAYRKNFDSVSVPAGSENDMYTGDWEVSVVPAENLLKDDTVNVGLWRDANGRAKAFSSNVYWKEGDRWFDGANSNVLGTVSEAAAAGGIPNGIMPVGNPSLVYGNNTANPIIGYGIDSGAIEIAQKK